MKNCHDAAKADECTIQGYHEHDRPRVFFTIGDDLCQC